MRLEKLSFSELKFLVCGIDEKHGKLYGCKRQVKTFLDKLDNSIKSDGWAFPIIVAELPNGDKYLIDGYARWKLECKKRKKLKRVYSIKHDALVIEARDLNHVKELYLQCQSRYGTASSVDFKALGSEHGYSRYELGISRSNFDLSVFTREEVEKIMLESRYSKGV